MQLEGMTRVQITTVVRLVPTHGTECARWRRYSDTVNLLLPLVANKDQKFFRKILAKWLEL